MYKIRKDFTTHGCIHYGKMKLTRWPTQHLSRGCIVKVKHGSNIRFMKFMLICRTFVEMMLSNVVYPVNGYNVTAKVVGRLKKSLEVESLFSLGHKLI